MRTIKTRNSVKNIKVLDKSISASKRMKDAFVRTKDKAEETQSAHHATPTEYASDNIQGTTQSAARDTVYNLHTPRQKASENWNRAKGHFQEVKRQMPKERNRAAEQAKKTADTAKTKATELRSTADKAGDTARDAQTAVKDAKNNLREVRQSGRQTLREVKQKAKSEQSGRFIKTREYATNTTPGELPRSTSSISGNTPTGSTPQPTSGAANAAPRSGKLPKQVNPTAARNGGISKNAPFSPTGNTNNNPARSGSTPKSAAKAPTNTNAAQSPKGGISKHDSGLNTVKGGASRPNYMSKGVSAPKSAGDTAKTLQSSAKTTGKAIESTKKGVKETAKGTVKTAKKSIKTAEKTAKKAVKTAKQTAKTAHKTAKAAAKTAKTAERAARAAAKAAAQTAKVAVKAITAMVKATIAAIKGLVSAIAAGGWVAVLVILIICMIGLLVGSIFGIFFSSEPSESGKTINSVIAEIDTEYTDTIDGIIASNPHDLLDMSGARASWKEVLAVYTVKTVNDPDNPMEVATIDDTKAALLRSAFWEMNSISYVLDSYDTVVDVLDGDGLPTGETTTVTTIVLRISVTHKTPVEMAVQYGFTAEQTAQLEELLKPEYHSLWNALLYGITKIGDGSMISVAETQLGNVGGEPYWSWYGFTSRVEWCATFVSWVAEQCGFIDAGIIPRFSACTTGEQWFKDRGQWQDNTYTPRPGDIIFFDWESDGHCDHVGIVESVADGKVNTIEGNSSDSCRRRSYDLGSVKIYGYGVPVYN